MQPVTDDARPLDSPRRTPLWVRVSSFAMGMWLAFALLLLQLWAAGCLPEAMSGFMFRASAEYGVGATKEDCAAVSNHVASYLRGEKEDFQLELNGVLLFNDQEMAHMADVRGLYRLLEQVLLYGTGGFLALLVWQALFHQQAKRALQRGMVTVLLLVGVFSLGMVVDFHTFFSLFHLMLFTNDLWILDPAQSLLVRLMNRSFFTYLAVFISLMWAGTCLMLLWLTANSARRRRKK